MTYQAKLHALMNCLCSDGWQPHVGLAVRTSEAVVSLDGIVSNGVVPCAGALRYIQIPGVPAPQHMMPWHTMWTCSHI